LILAVLCLLPLLEAGPVAIHSGPKGWTDEYIDMILGYLQGVIAEQGLDPADLPGAHASFSDTVLGITFHGSADCYNGKLSGLSTLHRSGNTDFTLDEHTLTLLASLGLNDLSGHYDAKAEFMGVSVGAGATLKINSVDVYFSAIMPLENGGSLQIQEFQITNIGHIDIDISGLGPLNWILETVVGAIGNVIRDFLADVLEGPIKGLLQDLLDQYVPELPSAVQHAGQLRQLHASLGRV